MMGSSHSGPPPRKGWEVPFFAMLLTVALISTGAITGACQLSVVEKVSGPGECFEFWFNRYQTFVAGVFALIGAWATIRGVRAQIAHLERQERQQRKREIYAAKAVLPLSLSQITSYANECIVNILTAYAQFKSMKNILVTNISLQVPDIPSDITQPIQYTVRFSDRSDAQRLANLLVVLQVQHSRLNGLQESLASRMSQHLRKSNRITVVVDHHFHSAVLDAANVYALASSLFEYARREDEGETASNAELSDMVQALHINGVWEEEHPELFKLLHLRERSSANSGRE